mgnify:FL=1
MRVPWKITAVPCDDGQQNEIIIVGRKVHSHLFFLTVCPLPLRVVWKNKGPPLCAGLRIARFSSSLDRFSNLVLRNSSLFHAMTEVGMEMLIGEDRPLVRFGHFAPRTCFYLFRAEMITLLFTLDHRGRSRRLTPRSAVVPRYSSATSVPFRALRTTSLSDPQTPDVPLPRLRVARGRLSPAEQMRVDVPSTRRLGAGFAPPARAVPRRHRYVRVLGASLGGVLSLRPRPCTLRPQPPVHQARTRSPTERSRPSPLR